MVSFSNKLENIEATKSYLDFGLEQVNIINKKYVAWIAQQSFVKDAVPSEFIALRVNGQADHQDSIGTKEGYPYPDKVSWELKFPIEVSTLLSNALLHEKRLPDINAFNSEPNLFTTSDYIHISVSNGERGWVKTGEFPLNVHIEKEQIIDSGSLKEVIIPVYTDIKRDAIIGFKAAYQWQRFRAMAVSCSDFLQEQLRSERAEDLDLDSKDYNKIMRRRSRLEHVYPLFVQFLPDTTLEETPTELKTYYRPGALEAVLATELEPAIQLKQGQLEKGEIRPIFYATGKPIEINSIENNGYSALIKFHVNINSTFEDEDIRKSIEEQLKKHYSVSLNSRSEIIISYELKEAHKVDQAIRDGATDTELHKFTKDFINALNHVDNILRSWQYTELEPIKKKAEKSINDAKAAHFSKLELMLENK